MYRILIAVAVTAALPLEIHAQDPVDFPDENQQLRSRIDRLESLVDDLRTGSPPAVDGSVLGGSPTATFTAAREPGAIEHASHILPGCDTSDIRGTPHSCDLCTALNSPPGAFPSVRLTGFFQADAGWVIQDSANKLAVGDAQDGADFRRARLAATGNAAENVGYMLEMDFGFPGRPSFMDVWGEVRELDTLQNFRFGQFRHPIGLDGLTSVKNLTFLERGLPFAFLPFRQVGVMAHGGSHAEDMTWAISGFRFPTDTFGGNIGDKGYGLATRETALLFDDGGDVLHAGAAYSFINPANNRIQYRSQPEFFVAETGGAAFVPVGVPTAIPVFVDTGAIATDSVHLFGGELVATSGSWHAQGELMYAVVNRMSASTVTFSGLTAQTGYLLTGEHRPYDRKSGVLGNITPHHDFGGGYCGAWEVAARWSYLDLNDGGVNGGRMSNITAGVNWYLNAHTKFQLNYIHAFLSTAGVGDSNADVIALRAQVDF